MEELTDLSYFFKFQNSDVTSQCGFLQMASLENYCLEDDQFIDIVALTFSIFSKTENEPGN